MCSSGIYFDAGGSTYNAGAVTGYDTDRPFTAQNLRLATLVQNDVLGAMNAQGWGIPNLGVTDDSQLGGPALSAAAGRLRAPFAPGPGRPGLVLHAEPDARRAIEPLFITDPYEGTQAASRSGQQVIAGGLAQAIEQYFTPAPSADKKPQPSTLALHGGRRA